jgi:hypothetical protein
MLTLALLVRAALADVELPDTDPCASAADGTACTTTAGDAGTCKDGDCAASKSSNTICGVVGTATLPLVLAALIPAWSRRRTR